MSQNQNNENLTTSSELGNDDFVKFKLIWSVPLSDLEEVEFSEYLEQVSKPNLNIVEINIKFSLFIILFQPFTFGHHGLF